jgi:hypothetical protein
LVFQAIVNKSCKNFLAGEYNNSGVHCKINY